MNQSHPPTPRWIWALLVLMIFFWSINFVVAKRALREFPPLLLGALRFTVAGAFILPIYLFRREKRLPIAGNPWTVRLLGIGLLGVGANQLTFLIGLERTTVGHAALIFGLTPILVLLMSAWVGHERITRFKVAGLAISLTGVGVLQVRSLLTGNGSPLGDFFVFLAAFTFAIFTVGGKTVRNHVDGLTINTYAYVGSGLMLSPVTLWNAWRFPFGNVTVGAWLAMLYMAVFPSLIAYMIYSHALRYMPSSRIATVGYLQPFMAMMFAVPLLGEQITLSLGLGGLMVLMGVILAERHG